MPVYPYSCKECTHDFEVAKPLSDIDVNERCPECSGDTRRTVSKYAGFYGAGEWDINKFDPAFGCAIKSATHRKRLAKERGWTEVGNEDVGKWADIADRDREKKLDQSWDKI